MTSIPLAKDTRLKFDIEVRGGKDIAVNIQPVKVAGNVRSNHTR
jgi:hypothetical protein